MDSFDIFNTSKMTSDYDYLLSLQAIREQAAKVYAVAKDGKLKHFDFNPDRMQNVADYVSKLIDVGIISNTKIQLLRRAGSSATLAPIDMTAFHPMGAGSISRWAT